MSSLTNLRVTSRLIFGNKPYTLDENKLIQIIMAFTFYRVRDDRKSIQ